MTITKKDVRTVCEAVAPRYGFDAMLVYAICLQEGEKDEEGQFEPDVARLEQGYYRRYVEKQNDLATTSEILLSASYGVMQMMGLSLKELGFFEWYFKQCPAGLQAVLKDPLTPFAVVSAIDAYCENVGWMVEWGVKWLAVKKKLADGNEGKMLDLWNGDLTGKYRAEVLARYKKLKGGA